MRWDLALLTLRFQQLQHLNELAEDEHFLAFRQEGIHSSNRFRFAGGRIVADQLRVAANLAQTGKRGEHMDFALVQAFSATVCITCSRPAQFGQISFRAPR